MDRETQRVLRDYGTVVTDECARLDMETKRLAGAIERFMEMRAIERIGWVLFGSRWLVTRWVRQIEAHEQAKLRAALHETP